MPVAFNTVGEGGGDDKVRAVTGVLVWVGSARAMWTSMTQRTTKVTRMVSLIGPGYCFDTSVLDWPSLVLTAGCDRLTSTSFGKKRPAGVR
jgi:hypothetical protein